MMTTVNFSHLPQSLRLQASSDFCCVKPSNFRTLRAQIEHWYRGPGILDDAEIPPSIASRTQFQRLGYPFGWWRNMTRNFCTYTRTGKVSNAECAISAEGSKDVRRTEQNPLAKGNVTATTPLTLLQNEQALSVPIGHAMVRAAPFMYGRKSTLTPRP
jgi:hypothetical protein